MTYQLDKPFVSYSEKKGDWDKRKISLFGVAKSIISQLKTGQDLTSIGLPAVFLQPYSLLELSSYRKLGHFNHLLNFNEVKTDVERMILVVRWFLSYISEEQPNKKPYNPVIGETHICKIEHGEGETTKFYSEQVSHHPPITAFMIKNKTRKIQVDGNFTFGVKFETNAVVCSTSGFIEVKSNDPNLEDEIYQIDKGLPDLMINNVIIGTRTMGWVGEVNIGCAKSNLNTRLNFKKHKAKITLEGSIFRDDIQLYQFEGKFNMNEVIKAYPTVDYLEETIIYDKDLVEKPDIIYPTPLEVPDLNSFKVWGSVTESIINNDMTTADIEKKRIEAEQRKRIKQWDNDNFIYFNFDEDKDRWVYNKKKVEEHKES